MIYPYQQAAYDELCNLARAWFSLLRGQTGFAARGNTLIIGPTGTGKSHLARAVAAEMDAAFLSVTTSEWIILGSSGKGATAAWQTIFRFILDAPIDRSLVICVEELCKGGHTPYEVMARTEQFRLLDLQAPVGVRDQDETPYSKSEVTIVEKALAERTWIIGTAAFQSELQSRTNPPLGFQTMDEKNHRLTVTDIGRIITPELAQRFRSRFIQLPFLTLADYKTMVETAVTDIPPYFRDTFQKLARQRLSEAHECQLGARFLGETYLDTVIFERRMARSPSFLPHEPVAPRRN